MVNYERRTKNRQYIENKELSYAAICVSDDHIKQQERGRSMDRILVWTNTEHTWNESKSIH